MKIDILDTTLRDGMQMCGVGCNLYARKNIAEAVMRTGVAVMEIGCSANSVDYAMMPKIARYILDRQAKYGVRPQIGGFARACSSDIDMTLDALIDVPANQKRIHLFVPSSKELIRSGIMKSNADIIRMVKEGVQYAREKIAEGTIEFSPEDAARTQDQSHYDFVSDCIAAAKGADVINIPDTTGWCEPEVFGQLVRRLRADHPNVPNWSVHVHNDSGQAVTSTLYAIKAGVNQIEGTVLGIGERVGNVDWMLVACNVIAKDYGTIDMRTASFVGAAHDVARYAGIAFPRNYPLIGRNAFDTSSGIHAKVLVNDPRSYYCFDPAMLGRKPRIRIGQSSGVAAVQHVMQQMHMEMPKNVGFVDALKWHCAKHEGKMSEEEIKKIHARFSKQEPVVHHRSAYQSVRGAS